MKTAVLQWETLLDRMQERRANENRTGNRSLGQRTTRKTGECQREKEALDRAMAQLESCITSRYEAKKHIAKETYRPALFEDAEEKKP